MNALSEHIIIMLFGFVAPFISGVVCLMIIFIFFIQNKEYQTKQMARVLMWELTACVFCWFSLICFTIAPKVYTQLEFLFLLGILYAQVFTYRFVFLHTRIEPDEPFSKWHYILPFIPSVAILICSLVFGFEERMMIRAEKPPIKGEFASYILMVKLVPILFFGYNLFYSFCSLRMIRRYSKAVKNYSADEGRYSTRWLILLVFIALSSLPLALIPNVLGLNFFFGSLFTIVGMSAIVFKDIVLTYNTITKNYTLIYSENDAIESPETDGDNKTEDCRRVNKEQFELYIRLEKPFLKPELRIADLASALKTNRTYLSSFINKEYGMNFSRFINLKRLEELKRISTAPEFDHMSGLDLVINAGFSNYRGYLRFKNEEDKRSQIAIDRR